MKILKKLLVSLMVFSFVWFVGCKDIPPPFTVTGTVPLDGLEFSTTRDEFVFWVTPSDRKKFPSVNWVTCPVNALTITAVSGCATKPTPSMSYPVLDGCAYKFSSDGSCRSQDQVKVTIDLSKVLMTSLETGEWTYSWGTYDLNLTLKNSLAPLPTNSVIFKTATAHDGNFGGVSGADTFCNSASNKPDDRTYKALIANETTRIACTTANCSGGPSEHTDWVLAANTTYYNASGSVIATTTSAGTFNFTSNLTTAIGSVGDTVWTGLNTDWTTVPSEHCGAWQQNAGFNGNFGLDNSTTTTSIASSFGPCTTSRYLYCVSQD